MLIDVASPGTSSDTSVRSAAPAGGHGAARRRELAGRLRSIPLFAGLGAAALERVAEVATEMDVPRGTLLIERAQPGSGVFVILDGTVTVELRRQTVELGPSEFVGELSVLTNGAKRSARVRAATPVHCLALSRSDFLQLLESEPGFAVAVASVLARRLLGAAEAGQG